MTFGNLSRWLWRRRDSKAVPRPPFLFPGESNACSTSAGFSRGRHTCLGKQQSDEEIVVLGRSRRKSGVGRKSRAGPVDPEFGGVMVPVEGVCMSDSDSGHSDWSIGWFEPQSSEFSTETESEKSFAFLVPCYSLPAPPEKVPEKEETGGQDPKAQLIDAVLSNSPSQDSQKYVQQWLDSLKSQ